MTSTGTLHVDARDDAVRHITAGNSVDLQGLPGAGCSLLARAIADELEDAGWQVVRVYGVSALRERPLEVLSIAGLVARQGTPQGPATAVSAAVQGILAAVRGGSTVMVIDNVAYLDEISAGAITAAHSQYPFPVLTTTHPRPRPARPESLITAAVQPGVTMQIPPLGYVDTQTLLVETLGGPVESSAVGRIFDASGGLPSMTLSLLDIARNHGTLKLVDGLWQAGPDLWTPEMTRAVEPLLHPLSPGAIDALQALALAGTIDVSTARRLMSWDVLEELDGYKLLRFVPRGDDMLVGVFPLAIIEFFRHHGVGARHLRVDEAVTEALGGTHIHRHISTVTPWSLDLVGTPDIAIPPRIGATTSTGSDADVIVNRLLVEHWHRELLLRRTEWDHTPTPRTAAILLRTLLITGADPEAVLQVRESTPRIGDSRDLAA
ncbi:MAG: hypothetical protein LBB54_02645, partial [Cellulomonadaceae bacterium]|nr:hypothetical protein [Cellulomonadaceae bacterium]